MAKNHTCMHHSNHIISAHNQLGDGDHSMMKMYFHGGFEEIILFDFWTTTTIFGFCLSTIAIFVISILYEGLKLLREYLLQREIVQECAHMRVNSRESLAVVLNSNYTHMNGNAEETSPSISPPSPLQTRSRGRCPCPTSPGRSLPQITRNIGKPRMCRLTHIIQTVLHLIQLTISYILMLIAMTYNVYLFGAVVLGAATGHFIFAWKRTTLLDCTEHCH